MSIYPSLEDMVVHQMMTAQETPSLPRHVPVQPPTWVNPSLQAQGTPRMDIYPGLASYMGMELTQGEIQANMPQFMPQTLYNAGPLAPVAPTAVVPSGGQMGGGLLAPLSSSHSLAQVSHGIRQLILCKDGHGKVGLRVKSIDKGIFVCLVTRSSPAALGGLRFGDQILQVNGENLAGYSASKVHEIFKKAGVNNIVLAVRDRPFERCLTLHKDSTGHLGFQFRDGKITSIALDSSAARNGLLIEHNLLEIDGQNVVGMKDKEVRKIIDEGGPTINITVIPSYIFRHMMKNMSDSIVQKLMDHSTQEL
uniref:Syntenin-1 n=1 Tax=Caligus rogercresseyi TaxID=217165 RepID=C1BQC8_CALRO|nr:Syntenin-1 [Caligus rogercresseyi]